MYWCHIFLYNIRDLNITASYFCFKIMSLDSFGDVAKISRFESELWSTKMNLGETWIIVRVSLYNSTKFYCNKIYIIPWIFCSNCREESSCETETDKHDCVTLSELRKKLQLQLEETINNTAKKVIPNKEENFSWKVNCFDWLSATFESFIEE